MGMVKRRGHVDQDVPAVVEATGLEDQYLIGSIGRQPIREHTSR